MRRALFALTVLFLLTSQALAWSDAGHKIIASIAFSRLTDAERDKVIEILREHPRFKVDFLDRQEKGDGDSLEWFFQEAAIWPDLARGFKGEDHRLYNHPAWHYINLPSYLNEEDEKGLGKLKVNASLNPPERPIEAMNAIQAIRLARAMLVDPDVSKSDKAIMLCWLSHVVGDIHQPLHSTALFSQKLFPDGDRGGNLILTKQHRNLHAVWDGFLGGKTTLREAHQEALKLMADGDLRQVGERQAAFLDEADWLEESRKLAVDFAYGPLMPHLRELEKDGGTIQPIFLKEDYFLLTGGAVSRMRVVSAGYRLAEVLKEIVD